MKKLNFTYRCVWCTLLFGAPTEFTVLLPDDLDNCMVRCPKCKTFLKKMEYVTKRKFDAGIVKT